MTGLPVLLRWRLAGPVLAASVLSISCHGRTHVAQPRAPPNAQAPLPSSPPPPQAGLLYDHPLDNGREGVFTNSAQVRAQVGADQFTIPDAATITGIRWYGYRNCLGGPGTSQAFEIGSFLDRIPARCKLR